MKSDNSDNKPVQNRSEDSYIAGRRSITVTGGRSRFDIVKDNNVRSRKSRPFKFIAILVIVGILAIPIYAFYGMYIKPPTEVALRVKDKEYTRGDVVDYIRFNQRLSEDVGVQFEIGNSLFDAMQTLQDNELAFQLAPGYGIVVEPEEVDKRLEDLLGFVFEKSTEISTEDKVNLEESKRLFLHRIGLPERVYRDFIRKTIFKERLRGVVGETVSRVQPQVHLFEIILYNGDIEDRRKIERDLTAGKSIIDITLQHSEDPNVKRNNGDVGWFPYGVKTELDYLLFGIKKDGSRILPVRVPSAFQYDDQNRVHRIYIVDEFSEAREVDDQNFEALVDRAMIIFLNEERGKLAANGELYMDLNDKIYSWVNRQVSLSSLLSTPTPSAVEPGMLSADQLR